MYRKTLFATMFLVFAGIHTLAQTCNIGSTPATTSGFTGIDEIILKPVEQQTTAGSASAPPTTNWVTSTTTSWTVSDDSRASNVYNDYSSTNSYQIDYQNGLELTLTATSGNNLPSGSVRLFVERNEARDGDWSSADVLYDAVGVSEWNLDITASSQTILFDASIFMGPNGLDGFHADSSIQDARIVISTNSSISPCGANTINALTEDFNFVVRNVLDPVANPFSAGPPPFNIESDISTSNQPRLELNWMSNDDSNTYEYVLWKRENASDQGFALIQESVSGVSLPAFTSVDAFLSANSGLSAVSQTLTSLTPATFQTSGANEHLFTLEPTTDINGDVLEFGEKYQFAIRQIASTGPSNWSVSMEEFVLENPSGPDFDQTTLALTIPSSTSVDYDQSFAQVGPTVDAEEDANGDIVYDSEGFPVVAFPPNPNPSGQAVYEVGRDFNGELRLPVSKSLTLTAEMYQSDGSTAATPNKIHFVSVPLGSNNATDPLNNTHDILEGGEILVSNDANAVSIYQNQTPSQTIPLMSASGSGNQFSYTWSVNAPTTKTIGYTFKNVARGWEALDLIGDKFREAIKVSWYNAQLASSGTELEGAVPGETITITMEDNTVWTATAAADGTADITDFDDGSSGTLNLPEINSGYTVSQVWHYDDDTDNDGTNGTTNTEITNQILYLMPLWVSGSENTIAGKAFPGATVTLSIGDEVFTTVADATTGIYDFAGTTSSTTSPSTGILFSSLVPFTTEVAYTVQQTDSGAESAEVTGIINADADETLVPTISGAITLTGSSITLAGVAEAGSMVQLFDRNGTPLVGSDVLLAVMADASTGAYSFTLDLSTTEDVSGSTVFTSPYVGEIIQVGSTDDAGNTSALAAAFIGSTVYTSQIFNSAATSSSLLLRFESNTTLPSGINGLLGIEIADGVQVEVPYNACLDIWQDVAVQGTGSLILESQLSSGNNVESAQLKFNGLYLGPPTLEMNGNLWNDAHMIGSPMQQGFVDSDAGDETQLIGWDGEVTGNYYTAGDNIETQGIGFFAIVGSGSFLNSAQQFDVNGKPMHTLDLDLGYVGDNYSSTSAGTGWNLISNPYTCGWDWGAVSKQYVNGSFYIWDEATGGWKYWNHTTGTGSGITSSIIPPLQGIWVQTNATAANTNSTMSVSGTLGCLSGNTQGGFLKNANSVYAFSTVNVLDSNDTSESFIVDIENTSAAFDGATDAWHMNGHLVKGHLFSLFGSEEMASNAVSIEENSSVNMAFEGVSFGDQYELRLDIEHPQSDVSVVLKDRYHGTLWDMSKGPYSFTHEEAPQGFLKTSRFEVIFATDATVYIGSKENVQMAGASSIGLEENVEESSVVLRNNILEIKHPEEFRSLNVYDSNGRLVLNAPVESSVELATETWASGIYRIVLIGNRVVTLSLLCP